MTKYRAGAYLCIYIYISNISKTYRLLQILDKMLTPITQIVQRVLKKTWSLRL